MKLNIKRTLPAFLLLLPFLFWSCANDSSSSTNSNTTSSNSTNSNSENNTTKTKVNLVTDFPDGTTIWTGKCRYLIDGKDWLAPDNWLSLSITNVKAGDLILISHQENSASSITIEFEATGANWKDNEKSRLLFDGKNINCDRFYCEAEPSRNIPERGNLKLYTANQTTGFYLSEHDAKIINDTGGFLIYGAGFTITKVVIVSNTAEYEVQGVTFKTDFTYKGMPVAFRIEGKGTEQKIAVFLFWLYDSEHNKYTWVRHGLTGGNGSLFHMEASYTLNKHTRAGTISITSASMEDATVPEGAFASGKTYSFTYPADVSTITLVDESNTSNSFTFKYDSRY